MSRDWTFFLEDILEASNKVLRDTRGMTLDIFQRDELVFDAVVRILEFIGAEQIFKSMVKCNFLFLTV